MSNFDKIYLIFVWFFIYVIISADSVYHFYKHEKTEEDKPKENIDETK